MFNLSENYYLRKCFFQREQVPTQSMIKKKMSPPLAAVYFKSMHPRLKEIAGLEPSLKGGGNDWYVPPEELLGGRAVLKPVSKEILAKLNHHGIEDVGTKVFEKHLKALDLEKENALFEADINWRNDVTNISNQEKDNLSVIKKKKNTEHITNDFKYFSHLYRQSLDKIETIFHESAIAEIKNTQKKALHEMQNKNATALHYQVTMLYDEYEKKLMKEKAKLKTEFLQKLEICRTDVADKIHDLNVDKHMAIQKLRQCVECQNLACKIYVALKEREECSKDIKESKHTHRKKVRFMIDDIVLKDLEVRLAGQKEQKRKDFCNAWQKKVCKVVKNFQKFVSYCLNILPDHAEFFINMEKLMLLQVSKTLEDPSAESIIVVEKEQFQTPVPQPKPFYLFCDKGYKARVDQELCPKHSGTSSTSQLLPAIIINKRCLYAACHNFEQFTNKIKDFIHGIRGDDIDFKDDLIYEHFVPVKYTPSKQLFEIKLESSLLQVLQQEIAYMQTDINKVPEKCSYCDLPGCNCTCIPSKTISVGRPEKIKLESSSTTSSGASSHKISLNIRSYEWDHEREPKWKSFLKHVKPKKCSCDKTAKKDLAEHLPVYMRHMRYGPPEIPVYEICSVTTLRALVKEARKEKPPAPAVKRVPSKIKKDMSTQFSDLEFENLCTCFSVSKVSCFLSNLNVDLKQIDSGWANTLRVVDGDVSPSYMTQRTSSFATARALSLRNLVDDIPDLRDIFKKDCDFE